MDVIKKDNRRSSAQYFILGILFVGFNIWFFYLHTLNPDSNLAARQLWGSAYQVIALLGGIIGLFISKKWGGLKSLIGRAIFFLSLSLLLQSFGQSVSSYYNYVSGAGLPYPSLGDVGFFGSTICYIVGAWLLAKATGIHFSLKTLHGKVVSFIVPVILIGIAYFFFLRGYVFDWSAPVKIFLDFGYPLGDALYVSLATIAFILSTNFLGGIMRKPILFLIFALIFQYVADFTFLYQSSSGAWSVAGINDYLYFASYFIMAISLVVFGDTFNRIKNSGN